jgi:hypothetical protein
MAEFLFEVAMEAVLWVCSWIKRSMLAAFYGVEWVIFTGYRALTGRRER